MSNDRGRYHLVYERLWRDPRFRGLERTARELTLYLTTGPQCNRIGLFTLSLATAAEDLKLGADTCRTRLADVTDTWRWHFDADSRVFYIPSWWKWNPPQNESVLVGNLKDLNEIPDSPLLHSFAANIEHVPVMWRETFLTRVTTRVGTRPAVHIQVQKQVQGQGDQDPRLGLIAQVSNPPNVTAALLAEARVALRECPHAEVDYLIDHVTLNYQRNHKGQFCSRAEVVAALAKARVA